MDRLENRGVVKQVGENTTDLFLKWGNKKRLRCVRIKDPDDTNSDQPYSLSGRRRIRRRVNSRFVAFPSDNHNNQLNYNQLNNNNNKNSSTRLTRNSETIRSENSRKQSPEKDVYSTRGVSPAITTAEKLPVDGGQQKVKHVWPKLYLTVSNKEKEEDFMAMKGCKPSHRPKKRPKLIQRSLLLVSPGAWLSDICQDRYDVIEKKNTKKRPTGLKAMGSMESDSE